MDLVDKTQCDLCKSKNQSCVESDEFDFTFSAFDNAGINTHDQMDCIKIHICFDCVLELLGAFHP